MRDVELLADLDVAQLRVDDSRNDDSPPLFAWVRAVGGRHRAQEREVRTGPPALW